MKTLRLIGTTLVTLVFLLSACSPQATPTAAPSAPIATAVPATDVPAAVVPAAAGTTVMLGKSDALGSFLVDDKNMTLYLFTKDSPNTSNCYDKCAIAWPPLLTTGAPVPGEGLDAAKLGTTKRKDGAMQVTYNGWPLYYYVKDSKAGDTVGQDVGQVWYVISPAGDQVASAAAAPAAAAPAAAAPTVMLAKNDKLGSFLVDAKSMTLYLFTKDSPNTSNCYDKCAIAWPPLLTTGAPVPGEGLDAAKLGTTKRKDGAMQVTYNGWPLYYYVKDSKAGDTVGQDVGQVWYVISPAGDQVASAAAAPAAAAPAAAAPTVMLAKNDKLGSFLVDARGMALYLFTKDVPNTSNCYDKCATAWPPLLTTGALVPGEGLDAAKLGTTKRKDGSMQVTYNGWPVYYFVKDAKPGDIAGENVGDVWYLISVAGDQIKAN